MPMSDSHSPAQVKCAICGKPLRLEDSKVTEDGQPVHEACYVEKLTKRKQQ